MSFTPTSGQYAAAQFTPVNTAITVPGINWDLKVKANPKDVSNFRDGRKRAATLNDYTLTLTLVWDSGANPLLAANGGVTQGATMNVTLFTDQAQTNTKAWTGPVIISEINPKNAGVEDVVMMDVTADANGTLTEPST